jgi:hypothetical protein
MVQIITPVPIFTINSSLFSKFFSSSVKEELESRDSKSDGEFDDPSSQRLTQSKKLDNIRKTTRGEIFDKTRMVIRCFLLVQMII